MRKKLIREIPQILLLIFPTIYLAYNWGLIPDKVATHLNVRGEADQWGTKHALIPIILSVPIVGYVLLNIAESLDPKKQLTRVGKKFYFFRIVSLGVISTLTLVYVFTLTGQEGLYLKSTFALIGYVFAVVGNYFFALRPNSSSGFLTPWTLESDEVWKVTHQTWSVVWFFSGIVMLAANVFFRVDQVWLMNWITSSVLILGPFIYSYGLYKRILARRGPC